MMYSLIKKLGVIQTTILDNQLGVTYNLLNPNKDPCKYSNRWNSSQICGPKKGVLSYAVQTKISKTKRPKSRRADSKLRIGKNGSKCLNISNRCSNLTLNKGQLVVLNGRIIKTPNSQVRYYPGIFKRIFGYFWSKPKEPVNQGNKVKTAPIFKVKDICQPKPPPLITFEKATECNTNKSKKCAKSEVKEVVCSAKVSARKEKPPFEGEDGLFVEERLCKEMPDKKCDRIVQNYEDICEKLSDFEQIRESERLQMAAQKLKTCIKNKKRPKRCQENQRSKDECRNTKAFMSMNLDCQRREERRSENICNVPEKDECDKSKKSVSCVQVKIKDDCIEDKSKDKCKNVKPCTSEERKIDCQDPCSAEKKHASNAQPKIKDECVEEKSKEKEKCKNVNPCKTSKKEDKKCKNVKPCKAVIKGTKSIKLEKCVSSAQLKIKDDSIEDICKNVKPCTLKEKKIDYQDPCSAEKKQASSAQPKIKDECVEEKSKEKEKCKNVKPCKTSKKADKKCKNVKPCKAVIKKTKSVKLVKCGNVKPCETAEKKSSSCKNLIPCEVKTKDECEDAEKSCESTDDKDENKDEKNDKCRNTKACETSKKKLCDPKCRNVQACKNVKKEKDDDCKKKPPEDGSSCGGSDSSKACEESNKCESSVNCSALAKIECEMPELLPIFVNGNLELMKKLLLHHISKQISNIAAYSNVKVKLDKLQIMSLNLDAVDQSGFDVQIAITCPAKKFLEPSHHFASIQTRDSRTSALSLSTLRKLYGIKPSLPPHILGKIPSSAPSVKNDYTKYKFERNDFNDRLPSSSYLPSISPNTQQFRLYCQLPLPPAQRDPRQVVEQREPTKAIEFKEPTRSVAIEENATGAGIEEPNSFPSMVLANEDKSGGSNCEKDKKLFPVSSPCCKQEKEKCFVSPEELKNLNKDKPPCNKPEENVKGTEICIKSKSPEGDKCWEGTPCNFDNAIKKELKLRKQVCKFVTKDDYMPCKPKTQLCCYDKKPKKPEIKDACCTKFISTSKKRKPSVIDCPIYKKFELLDLPPKPKPKQSKCTVKKCSKVKYKCPVAAPPRNVCKPVVKKEKKKKNLCGKCKKPDFPPDPPKPKKQPVSYSKCGVSPCYQKKCGKKKVKKPPCPTPIKVPRLGDIPESPPVVRKKKRELTKAEEAERNKKCKPRPKKCRRKPSTCLKTHTACDKNKNKKTLKKKEEKERKEKEEQQNAYAALKHTEWKAVPIKGNQRWCSDSKVEKNAQCKAELSKTVLPSKYDPRCTSPRYTIPKETERGCRPTCETGGKDKKNIDKKCTRKMSSYPDIAIYKNYCDGKKYTSLADIGSNGISDMKKE